MIYHTPKQLNSLPEITAGITYANRDEFNTAEPIRGLNFGENTETSMPVVKCNLEVLNHEINHNGNFALAEQVHGSDVTVISGPGYYTDTDGLITKEKDLLIGIKVADCAAILLSDPTNNIIAAVHAGWKGAAADILPHTLDEMIKAGAESRSIVCFVSPCISLKNFEVGEEVAEKFPPEFINRSIGKKPHLDLKEFLKAQLVNAGITISNIESDSRCTVDDPSFYSFRRERDEAGRMLAFIKQTKN